MGWSRLGQIYAPSGTASWARSHAALPVPVPIGDDRFRFFFSTRDASNESSIGWADIHLSGSPRILNEAREPALAPGPAGAFDDSGIGLGSVVPVEGGFRFYYMGWNLGVKAPWRNAIGLAGMQMPFERLERFSPGPILDRSPEDPYTLSYPWVLRVAGDDWRMWYGSNLAWGASNADMSHVVKAARSADGVRWHRDGAIVIGFASPAETAIARPSVIRIGNALLMAYAFRGIRYRIGCAVSADGVTWQRLDEEMGLAPCDAEWESEMTCYPALFQHRNRLWLAYNGNGYGATGFGLAVWDGDLPLS